MTVVLETERLFLRELLLNDVEPLTALLGDPEVTRFTGGPRDENAVRRWVQEQQKSYRERGYGYWAIIHRDSATLVGQAGLAPSLGCQLDAAYWGHGLGKEVCTAIRDYAFGELEIEHLTAEIDPKDKAGRKLAEAIGMSLEEDNERLVFGIHRENK